MKKVLKWFGIVIGAIVGIFVLLVILVAIFAPRQPAESPAAVGSPATPTPRPSPTPVPTPTSSPTPLPASTPKPIATPSPSVTVPKYTVLNDDVSDTPIKTQVTLDILVSGEITKDGLRTLLTDLYTKAQQRSGFKYHGSPTHIVIFAYTSREQAESGMGLWIAKLLRIGEKANPEIQIDEKLIALLGAKAEEKFGLSEEKRQAVWREIFLAEDRASDEAERRFPLPDPGRRGYSESYALEQLKKQATLSNTLEKEYKDEVAKKYGLTQEQLDQIAVEGVTKKWAFPR